MACQCQWRYEEQGTVKIGYRDFTCQECLDASEVDRKREEKMRLAGEIQALEQKSIRKLFDGEDLTEINAQRLSLRKQIQGL